MENTATLSAHADVRTERPARYMEQLCKHFEHKLPVTRSEGHGSIAFSVGLCELSAGTESLTMHLSAADAGALEALQDVVARHLKRFAFREEMEIAWRRA